MNAAQIHLALNHAPLFLSVIGGGILLAGLFRKNDSYISLALYFLIAAALFTIPVFQTGEGTEELVEKTVGVNETAIEAHEDMAKISLIIILITGAFSLAGLVIRKNPSIRRIILSVTALLALASFGTMAQTAHLGGLIRHTELQAGQNGAADSGKEGKDKEEDNKNETKKMPDSTSQQKTEVPDKDDDD